MTLSIDDIEQQIDTIENLLIMMKRDLHNLKEIQLKYKRKKRKEKKTLTPLSEVDIEILKKSHSE